MNWIRVEKCITAKKDVKVLHTVWLYYAIKYFPCSQLCTILSAEWARGKSRSCKTHRTEMLKPQSLVPRTHSKAQWMKRCSRLGVFLQVQRALVVVNSLLTEPQRGWCIAENEREKHRQPPVPLRALTKVRGEAWAKESMRGRQRGSEISTSVEKQAHGGEIDRGRRERRVTGVRGEDVHSYISSGCRGDPHIWLWPVTIHQAKQEILSGHYIGRGDTATQDLDWGSSWCLFSV